jgi:hypothetical protein
MSGMANGNSPEREGRWATERAIHRKSASYDERRFLRAAFAPSLPKAVRVLFGKWAMVFFRLAAVAAFLIFRRAAVRCLVVAMPRYRGRRRE